MLVDIGEDELEGHHRVLVEIVRHFSAHFLLVNEKLAERRVGGIRQITGMTKIEPKILQQNRQSHHSLKIVDSTHPTRNRHVIIRSLAASTRKFHDRLPMKLPQNGEPWNRREGGSRSAIGSSRDGCTASPFAAAGVAGRRLRSASTDRAVRRRARISRLPPRTCSRGGRIRCGTDGFDRFGAFAGSKCRLHNRTSFVKFHLNKQTNKGMNQKDI